MEGPLIQLLFVVALLTLSLIDYLARRVQRRRRQDLPDEERDEGTESPWTTAQRRHAEEAETPWWTEDTPRDELPGSWPRQRGPAAERAEPRVTSTEGVPEAPEVVPNAEVAAEGQTVRPVEPESVPSRPAPRARAPGAQAPNDRLGRDRLPRDRTPRDRAPRDRTPPYRRLAERGRDALRAIPVAPPPVAAPTPPALSPLRPWKQPRAGTALGQREARRGIVLMTILGPPRGLQPLADADTAVTSMAGPGRRAGQSSRGRRAPGP